MTFRLIRKFRRNIGNLRDRISELAPRRRALAARNAKIRTAGLSLLDQFSRERRYPVAAKHILVDGTWDNANFWVRYAIVRQSLGLWQGREIGLLGRFQRDRVNAAFTSFGIRETADFEKLVSARNFLPPARCLLTETNGPEDILDWELPGPLPASILYDGILKRQRRAVVDLDDPELVDYVAEALGWMAAARAILDAHPTELLVMSHAIDYTRGALVSEALARGIPVLVLYGDYGTSRFLHIRDLKDLRNYPGRPTRSEMAGLGPMRQSMLAGAGRRYLQERLIGNTDDVGAIYAYQRRADRIDRSSLCARYGWNPALPVVAVYAPNWFDYPHGFASFPYRDFLDWMELTISVARERKTVNWLFKPHPCDEWYGAIRGPKLVDLLPPGERHIGLCESKWNGHDLIRAIDGIVTCHGTIAVEAAWLGKPVLTTYPGWLTDGNFTVTALDRADYVRHLSRDWWSDWQAEAASQRAALFAGAYFAVPDWHEGYRFRDDSEQDAIYWDLADFINTYRQKLWREVDVVREWFAGGNLFYHVYKMLNAQSYASSARRPDYDAVRLDPRGRAMSA